MDKEFEIIGEWFLPSSEDHKVHGVLKFHPFNGSALQLYGQLDPSLSIHELVNYEIILGVSSENKDLTLKGCMMVNTNFTPLSTSLKKTKPLIKIDIQSILVGIHILSINQLLFESISCEINNFPEWLGINGFKHSKRIHKDLLAHKVKMEYKLPKPKTFRIDENTQGVFNFQSSSSPYSAYMSRFEVQQRVQFSIKKKEDSTIDKLLTDLIKFRNFIILALYKNTYIYGLTLKSRNENSDTLDDYHKTVKVSLFMSLYVNPEISNKPTHFFDMLFDYPDTKKSFVKLIRSWYSKYEKLEPALNLLIYQFYTSKEFSVNTFLNLAQAAETFHSRIGTHIKSRIPKGKYDKMRLDVLKSTNPKYHPWLKNQFHFGNHPTLQTRLEDLVSRFSNEELDLFIPDKETFIKQVKHSRNYYTHYLQNSKKNALTGEALYLLSEKLKLLLVCAFLMETGISKTFLTVSIGRVKFRLFNHLWNSN